MGGRGSNVSSPAQQQKNLAALIKQRRDTDIKDGFYDANGKLTEWQQMQNDDAASKLDDIEKLDVSNYSDGYNFYDAPYQKFVLNYGLNDKPTVLSESDFDKYVLETGQQTMVRGYSSKQSRDRVVSDLFHTGTGYYGDGIYFGPESGGFADKYGNGDPDRLIHVALSPKARVVDVNELRRNMRRNAGWNLRSALYESGQNGSKTNNGESQWALKNGYNVIRIAAGHDNERYVALTRDALVIKKF